MREVCYSLWRSYDRSTDFGVGLPAFPPHDWEGPQVLCVVSCVKSPLVMAATLYSALALAPVSVHCFLYGVWMYIAAQEKLTMDYQAYSQGGWGVESLAHHTIVD